MQQHPHSVAQGWLAQASSDLESARWNLEGKRFDVACFLSQQAAEKALKAVLILRAGNGPRIHVIARLISELSEIDPRYGEILEDVSALDVFYMASRYPDAIGGAIPAASFKAREAELAIERAVTAVNFASEQIAS